jgi:hypothetical protein
MFWSLLTCTEISLFTISGIGTNTWNPSIGLSSNEISTIGRAPCNSYLSLRTVYLCLLSCWKVQYTARSSSMISDSVVSLITYTISLLSRVRRFCFPYCPLAYHRILGSNSGNTWESIYLIGKLVASIKVDYDSGIPVYLLISSLSYFTM